MGIITVIIFLASSGTDPSRLSLLCHGLFDCLSRSWVRERLRGQFRWYRSGVLGCDFRYWQYVRLARWSHRQYGCWHRCQTTGSRAMEKIIHHVRHRLFHRWTLFRSFRLGSAEKVGEISSGGYETRSHTEWRRSNPDESSSLIIHIARQFSYLPISVKLSVHCDWIGFLRMMSCVALWSRHLVLAFYLISTSIWYRCNNENLFSFLFYSLASAFERERERRNEKEYINSHPWRRWSSTESSKHVTDGSCQTDPSSLLMGHSSLS